MIIFFKKNHLKIKNKQSFVGGQGHVCFCVVLKQEYFGSVWIELIIAEN